MSRESPLSATARAVAGVAVVVAVLAAFLLQVVRGGRIPPWLVLLVSVLGLAAGASLLGPDAVRTAYDLVTGAAGERNREDG